MASPAFRVAIRAMPISGTDKAHGFVMIDSDMKECIRKLIERVSNMMRTPRALNALQGMAVEWARTYEPNLSSTELDEYAYEFKNALENASSASGCRTWPLTIVDMYMKESELGISYHPQTPQLFDLSNGIIALNGQRVYLYFEDYVASRPEQHLRWMELVYTYCHALAYVYTDFLTAKIGSRSRCSALDNMKIFGRTTVNAGFFFEYDLFRGPWIRKVDNSGWDHRFMPGVPTILQLGASTNLANKEMGSRDWVVGLQLEAIMNFAQNTDLYCDADFDFMASCWNIYWYPLPTVAAGINAAQVCQHWHDEWQSMFSESVTAGQAPPYQEARHMNFQHLMTDEPIAYKDFSAASTRPALIYDGHKIFVCGCFDRPLVGSHQDLGTTVSNLGQMDAQPAISRRDTLIFPLAPVLLSEAVAMVNDPPGVNVPSPPESDWSAKND